MGFILQRQYARCEGIESFVKRNTNVTAVNTYTYPQQNSRCNTIQAPKPGLYIL